MYVRVCFYFRILCKYYTIIYPLSQNKVDLLGNSFPINYVYFLKTNEIFDRESKSQCLDNIYFPTFISPKKTTTVKSVKDIQLSLSWKTVSDHKRRT